MSGGPIEFSFGCELDDRNRTITPTQTPVTTIQTTVSVPAAVPQALAPAKAAPTPSSPKDIVQLAKDRLKDVRVELLKMKELVKQRDELERLVAAAESVPKRTPKPRAKTSK